MDILGLRWHFFCRDLISNPRPVLDSLAQTTRVMLLDFFVKPQNGLFAFLLVRFNLVSKKWFPFFWHCIGPLSSILIFLVSQNYCTSVELICGYRFLIISQEIDVFVLKHRWHLQAQYYQAHTHHLDFLS